MEDPNALMRSLGFPELAVHHSLNHFDFARASRIILVIGPMGSGKTEFSARVWRDSRVALRKGRAIETLTSSSGADRRRLFFARMSLDRTRFPDYPEDALAYRGGFERCGDAIASVKDSFALESLLAERPEIGTWIVDECSFYDERVAYLMRDEAEKRGLVFICPTLVLNFRRETFNATARLLLENATDVFPLTAYCEHPDCMADSLYTYRYYRVDGEECPAPYFDPLIIIGGDREGANPREPSYCTRCGEHHYLPAKEYAYFTLKPMAEAASRGDMKPLLAELAAIAGNVGSSRLASSLRRRHMDKERPEPRNMATLNVPCLAERALVYLYAEQNLLGLDQLRSMRADLGLDRDFMMRRLSDNRRPVEL